MSSFKDYLVSAVVTFAAGVAIVLVPNLDSLTLDSFKDGTVVGLVFSGVRTGVKLVLELFLTWYHSK